MEQNTNDTSTIAFVNEPKQNFHYRYKSEMGKSHGVINGQVDGTFPKIKLNIDQNKSAGDFYILCTLHCYSILRGKVLSPLLLLKKNETKPNYSPIFQRMETGVNHSEERWWELKDYVIIRLAETDYKTSYENKLLHYNELGLPLEFNELLGEIDIGAAKDHLWYSGELNFLGVTVFNRIEGHYTLYKKTIYSCNIFNGDDLRIHQICNPKGSINGGTRVTILIKINSKFPIQIGIKKIHKETKQTEWNERVDVRPIDIFGNHAITFTMPPYGGPPKEENEIEVDLFVIVNKSTYKSNSGKFHYLNNENNLPRKRLRCMGDNNAGTSKDYGSKDYISRDKFSLDNAMLLPELGKLNLSDKKLEIKKTIKGMYEKIKSGDEVDMDCDTIFANLFLLDDCVHLYALCQNCKFRNFLINLHNSYGENLLHIACKSNKHKFIAPFIGMGCYIHKQDIFGRTPLHIAIDKNHNDCIGEILIILQHISNYGKDVQESFIKMLRTYNENGYTVMHTATLGGHYLLLESLLEFCIKHEINVWDYGTLDCGDSIGHLVFKYDIGPLKNLILGEYRSYFTNIKNYEGQTVKDLKMD